MPHSVPQCVPQCATVCHSVPATRRVYYHLANTCKHSNTPLSQPSCNKPPPPRLFSYLVKKLPAFSSYSQICFACPCFKNFPGANYLHPIHFKPWHEFLKTRFKTSRILSLYSQELQVKIKHKCQWTNNQQMSQLRYHCMPPRRSIRCTNT